MQLLLKEQDDVNLDDVKKYDDADDADSGEDLDSSDSDDDSDDDEEALEKELEKIRKEREESRKRKVGCACYSCRSSCVSRFIDVTRPLRCGPKTSPTACLFATYRPTP